MSVESRDQNQDPRPGSPVKGEPGFLAVGKLGRPHGVRGEILMDVLTDFPERLLPGKTLYLGEVYTPLRLIRARQHQKRMILHFQGYVNPEQASELRNQLVYVKANEIPALPEGDFYHHELVGLSIITEQGDVLGRIEEILETGANDVFVARMPSGKELLIPYINSVVIKIDLARGEVLVRPLPGLWD